MIILTSNILPGSAPDPNFILFTGVIYEELEDTEGNTKEINEHESTCENNNVRNKLLNLLDTDIY